MADISDIAQAIGQAGTDINSLSNIILVDPQVNVGITAQVPTSVSKESLSTQLFNFALPALAKPSPSPKFLFNYNGEESVTVTSDITDHFVEDNSSIQDHIAKKPVMITTLGYIGELTNVAPDALTPLKFVVDKLSTLGPFVPGLTRTAMIGYNAAVSAYTTVNTAARSVVSALESITGNGSANRVQTLQQKAFTRFKKYFESRTLFKVQTPWAIFENMAIMSMRVVSEEETRMISTFEMTFKQMRFAKTVGLTKKLPVSSTRRAAAASEVVNAGVSKPVEDGTVTAAMTASGL